MAARAESLAAVTEFLREGALEASLPQARVRELDLVIEEAVINVCRHAYPEGTPGPLTVSYSVLAPGELHVEVADQGVEFNPLTAQSPDLKANLDQRPVGGLGVFLIKMLAKSLHYRRESGWNRLTFAILADSGPNS
jgi:anti-sigma regulatory factor (Ser/Thr protein kinase)